jgi:hypothetical protein
MSVATLGVELASPLALLSRRLRHLFVAVWVMMHLVIVLLMIPNFWIQSWCVAVLLTDWEWLRRLGLRRFRSWEMPAVEPAFAVAAPRFVATVIGALLLATSAAPTLFQIEWYPFTHIPMYASYVAPGVVAGFPEEDLGIESRVRGIARSCAGNRSVGYIRRCPRQIPSQLAARLSLELQGPGRPPTPFTGPVDALRHHVIDHLAATSPASSGSASTEELARWVGALLASEPRGSLDGFDSFTLRYRLNEGAIELASGRFDPLDPQPPIDASPGSNP